MNIEDIKISKGNIRKINQELLKACGKLLAARKDNNIKLRRERILAAIALVESNIENIKNLLMISDTNPERIVETDAK